MPTGRDDVRFRVKTGSYGQTGKMTRLTHNGQPLIQINENDAVDPIRLGRACGSTEKALVFRIMGKRIRIWEDWSISSLGRS